MSNPPPNIQQPQRNPFLQQIYDVMLDQAIADVQRAYGDGSARYEKYKAKFA